MKKFNIPQSVMIFISLNISVLFVAITNFLILYPHAKASNVFLLAINTLKDHIIVEIVLLGIAIVYPFLLSEKDSFKMEVIKLNLFVFVVSGIVCFVSYL